MISHRERAQLLPGSLVDGVQLQLVVGQVELPQRTHSLQSSFRYLSHLIVLHLQNLEALGKTQRQRLQLVSRQIQGLQDAELPEGLSVELGAGEAVVAEVELCQGVERDQIVASDLVDEVVEQHEGLGAARKATGNPLQKVVVHVDGVETFETLEGSRMDGAGAEVVVVDEQVFQVSNGCQCVHCDALDRILLQVKQDEISRKPERNRGQVVIGQIQIFQTVQVTDERRQDSFHQLQLRQGFYKKVRKERAVQKKECEVNYVSC